MELDKETTTISVFLTDRASQTDDIAVKDIKHLTKSFQLLRKDILDTMQELKCCLEYDAKEYIDILTEIILGRTQGLENAMERTIARIRRATRTKLSNYIAIAFLNASESTVEAQEDQEVDMESFVDKQQVLVVETVSANRYVKDQNERLKSKINKLQMQLKRCGLTEQDLQSNAGEVIDGVKVSLYEATQLYHNAVRTRSERILLLQEKTKRINDMMIRSYEMLENQRMKRREAMEDRLAKLRGKELDQFKRDEEYKRKIAMEKEKIIKDCELEMEQLEQAHAEETNLEQERYRTENMRLIQEFSTLRQDTLRSRLPLNTMTSQVMRSSLFEKPRYCNAVGVQCSLD